MKKAIHTYLVFVLISISSLSLPAQVILEQEDARFQAQMKKELEQLDKMISEDLLFIHSNAFEEGKEAFLENVASGNITYSRMEAEPGREILYRKKTALVRGILQVAGSYEGGSFDIRVRYTAIYQKRKKDWLLLNWQSTKIPK